MHHAVVYPLLFLLDGHSSHYCPDALRLVAKETMKKLIPPTSPNHWKRGSLGTGSKSSKKRGLCRCAYIYNRRKEKLAHILKYN